MAAQRKQEISYLNIIMCLLVMFIHMNSYAVAALPPNTFFYNLVMFPWRMVTFVVPGFILLSGVKLFLTKKDEQSYGKYLFSRIKSVILPYVFCYFVYYAFYFIVYEYPLDGKFILKNLLLGSLACHFYFIPLLFQFDLLFPLWKRLINRCSPVIVIPFAIMLTLLLVESFPSMLQAVFPNANFIYNDRLFTSYLAYWIIGCYIGKYYDKFTELMKTNFRTVCGCFLAFLPIFLYFTYLAFDYIAYIPYMNKIHEVYIICVVIFLFALAMRLPEKVHPFLQKIDRASYDIYLWHMLFMFVADGLIKIFDVQSLLLGYVIRTFFMYVVAVLCCILLNQIKKKIFKSKRKPAHQ